MQWVKLQPCHMPQPWVMKCSLLEFIGNSGSFVRNAYKCLDKPVPCNANLWNTSSWREDVHLEESLRENRLFGFCHCFFCCTFSCRLLSFVKKWVSASARCTISQYSAGMPLLSKILQTRMEKSCRRESLSTVDHGSTSPFWIWWDTAE